MTRSEVFKVKSMSQKLRRPQQFIYSLAKKATGLAILWAILWMPSSCNRILLYINSADYHSVSFRVLDATYDSSSDSSVSYWLTGNVEGHEERLIPPLVSEAKVNSSEDLLKVFPRNTSLPAIDLRRKS
jgi:hypothetical protein